MVPVNGCTINEKQYLLLRELYKYPVGLYTCAIATQLGASTIDIADELRKLREGTDMIVSSGGPSECEIWKITELGKSVVRSLAHPAIAPTRPDVFFVRGPANISLATFAKEADAVREATARAKANPNETIEIYQRVKCVKWEPPVVPEGKLIID